MKTYGELTETEQSSYRQQFARNMHEKIGRKEVMALLSLTIMQSQADVPKVIQSGRLEATYTAHVDTSRWIIRHLADIDANWGAVIEKLNADFNCSMPLTDCINFLVKYIDEGTA